MVITAGMIDPEIFSAVSLLTPFDAVGHGKCRVGRNGDGGYVLLDLLDKVDIVYSFGISIENSFDTELAEAGKKVFMYDHTISKPPTLHANSTYFKKGIGPVDEPEKLLYSIQTLCADNGHLNENQMLLKMDVEGAELDVFAHGDGSLYKRFSQITFELHEISKIADTAFRTRYVRALNNLLRNFAIIHVHANNNRPVVNIGGLLVPDVLEITCVRRDLVTLKTSETVYPTRLDHTNNARKPDILLWFYPFTPGSGRRESFEVSLDNANRASIQQVIAKSRQTEAALAQTQHRVTELDAEVARLKSGQLRRAAGPISILYIGFHDVLAYDDIGMFNRLGFRVFSIKAFAKGDNASALRRLSAGWVDNDLRALYAVEGLSENFLSNFDVAIYVHLPGEDTTEIFKKLSSIPIVYRTIGQCTQTTEAALKTIKADIQVVRYSKNEVAGLDAHRTDAVIPFAKNASEFPRWEDGTEVVSFHNHYVRRKHHSTPMLVDYEMISNLVKVALYGEGNDGLSAARGLVPAERQMSVYAKAAACLYIHTVPTSYTLSFIEAMAVGCPVIVPSADYILRPASREARDKGIAIGRNNFISGRYDLANLVAGQDCIFDSAEEAVNKLHALLENAKRRAEISEYQRQRFKLEFDEDVVGPMWQEFLFRLVH